MVLRESNLTSTSQKSLSDREEPDFDVDADSLSSDDLLCLGSLLFGVSFDLSFFSAVSLDFSSFFPGVSFDFSSFLSGVSFDFSSFLSDSGKK